MTITESAATTSFLPAHRTRRRLGWLAVAVVVLGGLLASTLAYIGQYEPLTRGGGSAIYPTAHTGVGPPWATGDSVLVDVDEGDQFGFLFGIRNQGPLGVTILGVDTRFDHSNAQGMIITMAPTNLGRNGWDGQVVPFEPFSLGPDSERGIKMLFHFVECPTDFQNPNGRWDAMESVTVHYRVLGVRRQQVVDLPFTLGYRLHPERCDYD